MTVWVMLPRVSPASAQSPSASPISSPTRPRTLDARDLTEARARMPPARSASAPRTYWAPTSRPRMNPASGRTSYSSAERPGRPVRCPAVRTSPARSASASATETVGLDRPEMRASSAREHRPRSRMCPSRRRPFSARMSWGRAADSSPPKGPPTPLANGS